MSSPPTSLIGDDVRHLPVTLADLARLHAELIAEIKKLVDSRTPKSLLRMEKTMERVGLRKSSIQAKIAAGDFPAPVDLGGGRAIGFVSMEIDQWIEERIAASRRNGAAAREARAPIKAQQARKERKKCARINARTTEHPACRTTTVLQGGAMIKAADAEAK